LPAVAATIAAKAKGHATGQVVKNHFGAAEGTFSIDTAPSSPSHHLNDCIALSASASMHLDQSCKSSKGASIGKNPWQDR
jgi:hypothetical protein